MPKDFGINFEILPKIDFHSYRKIEMNWVSSNKRCVRKLLIFKEKHHGVLNEIFFMRIMFVFLGEGHTIYHKKYIERIGCELIVANIFYRFSDFLIIGVGVQKWGL